MRWPATKTGVGVTRGAQLAELGVWAKYAKPLLKVKLRYVGPWGEGEDISATYCFLPISDKPLWHSLVMPFSIVNLLVGAERATSGNFSFEFLFADGSSKQLTLALTKVFSLYRGRGASAPSSLDRAAKACKVADAELASMDAPALLQKDSEIKAQLQKEEEERLAKIEAEKKAALEARKQAMAASAGAAPAPAAGGGAAPAAFDPGGAKVGIFYGSTTGNTVGVGEALRTQFGGEVAKMVNVTDVGPDALKAFEYLLLGVPTWHIGEMQEDWAEYLTKLEGLDLKGKKVAIFGLGDGVGYPETYVDAMEELWGVFKPLGAELVGLWPTEGYIFEKSKAILDGKFMGLVIDIENQNDQTDERVKKWSAQVRSEFGL